MPKENVMDMSDAEHADRLRQYGVDFESFDVPTEENLIRLMSDTLRASEPEVKAQNYVELANMCLALADKTMGSPSLVPQCMFLVKH